MRILTLLLLITLFTPAGISFAGLGPIGLAETDNSSFLLAAPFDLRDRESYIQLTNIDSTSQNLHIQIYNVGNLCNENNFFDLYTPNDTHVYNLRDILTNDGSPSGVVLPEDAYGIVFISAPIPFLVIDPGFITTPLIGNIRMIDSSGYEYRTNIASTPSFFGQIIPINIEQFFNTFNFNSEAGIVLSDVFGIALSSDRFAIGDDDDDFIGDETFTFEATLDNVLESFVAVDVDIINNNEVLFSCRDVVFSCVDENNPLIEEILVLAGSETLARSSASVARFEYGINEAIPNSKGGELLCPGNIISEGVVVLTPENRGENTVGFYGYIGLNNGNGRGSMDTMFFPALIFSEEIGQF